MNTLQKYWQMSYSSALLFSFVFTLPWLGFAVGFVIQVSDFARFAILLCFWILIYFLSAILLKKCYPDNVRFYLDSRWLRMVLYVNLFIYFLYGFIVLYFSIQFAGSSGEFRMFVFDQAASALEFSKMFIIINVVIYPLIVVLQIFNFGNVSNMATMASLVTSIGMNSRFALLLSLFLLFLRFRTKLGKLTTLLLMFSFALLSYFLFYSRLDTSHLGYAEIVDLVFIHVLDYLTISSGVYDEYLKSFNYGVLYAPFTFVDTFFSQLFGFKSTEGRIADISSAVLFNTPHGTGPYNAYFTVFALFASPDAQYLGIAFGVIVLTLFLIVNFYLKNRLIAMFNLISLMLSGLMPNLFTLAWFFGIIWCLMIYRHIRVHD